MDSFCLTTFELRSGLRLSRGHEDVVRNVDLLRLSMIGSSRAGSQWLCGCDGSNSNKERRVALSDITCGRD